MTDPYGGPPGQPQGQPPFGQPAGQQPIGQQPGGFGQQPPSSGFPQSGFGQQPGGPQPGFGQAGAGGFGQQTPQPGYGQPPAYGQPPTGGYGQPTYGQPGGFGQPNPYGPPGAAYANWGQRAGAYLIDFAPFLVAILIAVLVSIGWPTGGLIIYLLAILGNFGWQIYNRWITAGKTGQSLGKRVVGIKLINEGTGQPVGAGMAFLRDLAHFLDGLACSLGYLWPLWDDKSQTFSDKIVGTIVVQADAAPAPMGGQFGHPAAPQQPYGGGFPSTGQPGGFPPAGFAQPAQPGGFGQPQPFGQQAPAYGQPQSPVGFGQPVPAPAGASPHEQAEPTQMIKPGGAQAESEGAVRTQLPQPEQNQPGDSGQQPPQH
ncbi:MAG TPA: RDD family protein [Amycolatopsis sp.]|nr:RDD family protein [Amycolatopsis sp.]